MDQTSLTTLQDRANGFLTDLTVENSRITDAVLVTAGYETSAYTDALFNKLNIPVPLKVHRSSAKRKADFLAGRALALAAMTHLGVTPQPVANAPSRAPIWPDGLAGSLSHARGRCACLLSRDTGQTYGVDTEAIAKDRPLAAILTETLSAAERHITTQGPLPAATNATLAFSAKEALFKTLYPRVGHHFGFDAAALRAAPKDDTLTLTLTTDLAQSLTKGMQFDVYFSLSTTHVLTWLSAPGA